MALPVDLSVPVGHVHSIPGTWSLTLLFASSFRCWASSLLERLWTTSDSERLPGVRTKVQTRPLVFPAPSMRAADSTGGVGYIFPLVCTHWLCQMCLGDGGMSKPWPLVACGEAWCPPRSCRHLWPPSLRQEVGMWCLSHQHRGLGRICIL